MDDYRVDLAYHFMNLEDVLPEELPHLEIVINEEALRHLQKRSRKIEEKKARRYFLKLRNLASDEISQQKDKFFRFARKSGIGGYNRKAGGRR